MMTIRYNCTNSYFSEGKSTQNSFTTVAKDRLRRNCYQGTGNYGSVTICPGANVTLQATPDSVRVVSIAYV